MRLAKAEALLPRRPRRTDGPSLLLLAASALAVCAGSAFRSNPAEPAGAPSATPAATTAVSTLPPEAAEAAEAAEVALLDAPTPAYLAPQRPPARTFVALGDSLTAWAFAPGSWRASASAAWPEVLASLDSGLGLLRNSGVPGNTTAQMLARFRSDVLAYRPDAVFILGGTNDVGKHFSSSFTVANLRTMVRLAKGEGIEVVLMTIPPNNLLYTGELRALRATNAALVRMAGEEGVKVVDLYAVLVNSSGRLPAAYAALDGLHLTTTAERLIAQTVVAELRPGPRQEPRRGLVAE
jgi:acyl-CoA thioesterase-1